MEKLKLLLLLQNTDILMFTIHRFLIRYFKGTKLWRSVSTCVAFLAGLIGVKSSKKEQKTGGMSKIDTKQLIKILNLTQSDYDGEALSAIRKVNAKLKEAGVTWEQLLSGLPQQEKPKSQYKWKEAPKHFNSGFFKNAAERQEFIDALSKDQHEWLNRLIKFYNSHHYLPEKTWTDFRELWHNFRETYRG